MAGRNILVCFDAFGTLFNPKTPVVQQYGEVARTLGLHGFRDDELGVAFSEAYKKESKQHPNFGKATGLGAEKWWTNIIVNTFQKVTSQELPSELAPRLLRRFHCNEGYDLYEDVKPMLHKLRQFSKKTKGNLVVGVITNSDDRVPDVLQAFGLRVNTLRYGEVVNKPLNPENDIDFSIMSYDVGYEKPDRRIFDAAVETLDKINAVSTTPSSPAKSWDKIYIGDEYKKDVVGGLAAGWSVALVDRDGSQDHYGVERLSDDSKSLFEVLDERRAIAARRLADLTKRIPD